MKIYFAFSVITILLLCSCSQKPSVIKVAKAASSSTVGSDLKIEDGITGSASYSPIASWLPAENAESYEVAIGTSTAVNDIKDWINIGSSTMVSLYSITSLLNGEKYFTSVRAVDKNGIKGPVMKGDGWTAIDEYKKSNSSLDFNDIVNSITSDNFGNKYIAGAFSGYNATKVNYVLSLSASGGYLGTPNFGLGFDNGDVKLIKLSSGKFLAYGSFTKYNGMTTTAKMIRLNSDGSIDNTFTLDSSIVSLSYTINKVVIDNSDNTYIGYIDYSGGVTRHLDKLNSDGSINTIFQTNISSKIFDYNAITYLAISSSGKIYSSSSTVTIRINSDGTIDPTFEVDTLYNLSVLELVNGNVLLSGYNPTLYDSTGSLVSVFNSNLVAENLNNSTAGSAVEQADGKIILIGEKNAKLNGIVRINSNGTKDVSFNSNLGSGFNDGSSVQSINLLPNGQILLTGYFNSFNQNPVSKNIIRLNSTGTHDSNFLLNNPGIDSPPNNVIVNFVDSSLVLAGNLTRFGGTVSRSILKIDNSNNPSAFSNSLNFDDAISKIIYTGNSFITIGDFTKINGIARNHIAKLKFDGSLDTVSFNGSGFSPNPYFSEIVYQKDGKILIAGGFIKYNNFSTPSLVRILSDGSRDTSFNVGLGFNGRVDAIAIQDDGKIIASGSFTSYKGIAVSNIIRLFPNGSIDSSFVSGTGFNGGIQKLKFYNKKIIACGIQQEYNGQATSVISMINLDGQIDSDFSLGEIDGMCTDFEVQSNNQILAIGGYYNRSNFDFYLPVYRFNFDGSEDQSFIIKNDNFIGEAYAFLQDLSGKIFLGGSIWQTPNGQRNYFEFHY